MDGGVDQGPWLQERVGGGRRGWMAVPKKGEGWGLVGGRVGLLGSSIKGKGG